jgi:HTH-type transcriptional regulator/antitoxin MqsA
MNEAHNGEQSVRCPACRKGQLHATTRKRVFAPQGKRVEVLLRTSVCDVCKAEITRPSQHQHNLQALSERKAQYGDVLLGEEIVALRKRYGLTQQQASKIFGKGKIAFSRYENETTYPDDSTRLLLMLAIESPAVLKQLADKAHVSIPLWRERCEDEQRVKVRMLRPVDKPTKEDFQITTSVGSLSTAGFRPSVHLSRHLVGTVMPRHVDAQVLLEAA